MPAVIYMLGSENWLVKKLTESVRRELKRPLGKLVSTAEAVKAAQKAKREGRLVVCVGDSCAYEFISAGVRPDVVVYDELCERKPTPEEIRSAISSYGGKGVSVSNPAGFVSEELEKAVSEAVSRGGGKIFVKGEEDLAALPAMMVAPDGSLIAYGQPGEGVVLVIVTPGMRDLAQSIYERMKSE